MTRKFRLSVVAAALSCTVATPLHAQTATADELAAMRAQLQAMNARITQLEGELAQAKEANAAQDSAITAQGEKVAAIAAAPAPAAKPSVEVAFKGAPEFKAEGGWTFKPRGRMQFDAGTVSGPEGYNDASTGFGTEVRRAYLGFEGKMPGGFGYRAEIDVAGSAVEITDLYLTYAASKDLTLMVGQTKPFWGLEEMTSDLFTSMTERAQFNSAFGFERRLGVNAAYTSGPVLVQAGVFTDNLNDLNNDENNSLSLDGRVVFMPKLASGQFHIGGSAHYHDLNDSAGSVRYRARPFIHTTDLRYVDTGLIAASSESGYGLETAWTKGPFHLAGEAHWQTVNALIGENPTFFGGYAEAGIFLTKGDTRGYKGGTFDRTTPKNPVGGGGIGAIEFNVRYDTLDLADAGYLGGSQDIIGASLVWMPTAYTKLMANYGHMMLDDAAIAAADGDRDYTADAFGVRAQIDF